MITYIGLIIAAYTAMRTIQVMSLESEHGKRPYIQSVALLCLLAIAACTFGLIQSSNEVVRQTTAAQNALGSP